MSYKEALISNSYLTPQSKVPRNPPLQTKTLSRSKTLYVTGFDVNTRVQDLWEFFRRKARVQDIILPNRRDRYNKRYGFVVTPNSSIAGNLIKGWNGCAFGGHRLFLSYAKSKKATYSPEPTHTTNNAPSSTKSPNSQISEWNKSIRTTMFTNPNIVIPKAQLPPNKSQPNLILMSMQATSIRTNDLISNRMRYFYKSLVAVLY